MNKIPADVKSANNYVARWLGLVIGGGFVVQFVFISSLKLIFDSPLDRGDAIGFAMSLGMGCVAFWGLGGILRYERERKEKKWKNR